MVEMFLTAVIIVGFMVITGIVLVHAPIVGEVVKTTAYDVVLNGTNPRTNWSFEIAGSLRKCKTNGSLINGMEEVDRACSTSWTSENGSEKRDDQGGIMGL